MAIITLKVRDNFFCLLDYSGVVIRGEAFDGNDLFSVSHLVNDKKVAQNGCRQLKIFGIKNIEIIEQFLTNKFSYLYRNK